MNHLLYTFKAFFQIFCFISTDRSPPEPNFLVQQGTHPNFHFPVHCFFTFKLGSIGNEAVQFWKVIIFLNFFSLFLFHLHFLWWNSSNMWIKEPKRSLFSFSLVKFITSKRWFFFCVGSPFFHVFFVFLLVTELGCSMFIRCMISSNDRMSMFFRCDKRRSGWKF